ncbi:MAG: hypothetical protein KAJ14_06735, partial [Candidatus Omnitrophica bacterium]|nr:hypothetical protein [Candidatus Omnitrophota bacterium]
EIEDATNLEVEENMRLSGEKKEALINNFKELWEKAKEKSEIDNDLHATDQEIELLFVEGKDTEGNECNIYVGDIVIVNEKITPEGPTDQKYAVVNKIDNGKIQCVFCDEDVFELEDMGDYDSEDVFKLIVSEQEKRLDYKVGEKLIIQDSIDNEIIAVVLPDSSNDLEEYIRVAVFEDGKLVLRNMNPVKFYNSIFARDWQEFDELNQDEKPVSFSDMFEEAKKILKDFENLFGQALTNFDTKEDLMDIEFENGIKLKLSKDLIEINDSLEMRRLSYCKKRPRSSVNVGKTGAISSTRRTFGDLVLLIKYLDNEDGTGNLWIVTDEDLGKGFNYSFGNLSVNACPPVKYVEMMKERRKYKAQGSRLKDKG